MTIFEDVVPELLGVLKTAFNLGANSPQIREVRAARIDWRGLVEQYDADNTKGLHLPYVVLHTGVLQEDLEWSPMDDTYYRLPVSIFYIDKASISEIDAQIQAAHAALRENATYTHFSIFERFSIDNSDTNAANAVFLEASSPLLAGSLSGWLMTREG